MLGCGELCELVPFLGPLMEASRFPASSSGVRSGERCFSGLGMGVFGGILAAERASVARGRGSRSAVCEVHPVQAGAHPSAPGSSSLVLHRQGRDDGQGGSRGPRPWGPGCCSPRPSGKPCRAPGIAAGGLG